MKFSKQIFIPSSAIMAVITAVMTFVIPYSCSDDESFTKSSNSLLSFPSDTLEIDTTISDISSATYSFAIHNHNSKGIKITNISLASGGESGFQVNVDGVYINDGFADPIEVRHHDSITVYMKMKSKFADNDTVQNVYDKLLFTLESGVVQAVTLLGHSQDVITLKNVTFTSDTTLSSTRPLHILGNLTVDKGSTLRIAAGTKLLFSPSSSMIVKGTLKAEGTLGNEVVFRGDRLDHMFENQPYDRIPGQWKGITFTSTSSDNYLGYCDIHSGSTGITCDTISGDSTGLKIENSVLHNMKGNCFTSINSNVFVGNTQITNALGNCVTIYGGSYEFIHCTIGNFYPFEGNRGKTLYLYNMYDGKPQPLEKALFANCIISGWSTDEIYGVFLDDNTAKDYLFRSCLLTTPEVDDKTNYPNSIFEDTNDTLWGSKNFKKFDYDNLIFDFHLDTLSKARDNADVTVTSTYYPCDRDGNNRLDNDGKADIGCYEFK